MAFLSKNVLIASKLEKYIYAIVTILQVVKQAKSSALLIF